MPMPRKMLDQATANTRSGLTEARRALHALRPLEDLGLVLALNTLTESVAARAGLNLDYVSTLFAKWGLPIGPRRR
jgi:signal transduction histidine kinase